MFRTVPDGTKAVFVKTDNTKLNMELQELSFEELRTRVLFREGIKYDLEFARRIADRKERESNFFFNEYSVPFLQDIAVWIAHEDSYRAVLGFYYDYVSAPLEKNDDDILIPRFRMLRQYDGRRGAHLYTYVMRGTYREAIRYYRKDKPGSLVVGPKEPYDFERAFMNRIGCENEEAFIHADNDEIGWEILNAFFYEEADSEAEHEQRIKKVKKAYDWLQEKDRLVLQLVVIEDKSGLEAFEQLKQYLRPKSKNEVIDEWSSKKKQDTVSLWKTRALEHLEAIVKDPNLNV